MGVCTNVLMLIVLSIVAAAVAGGIALPSTRLGVVGAAGSCLTYVIAYASWYLALNLVRPVRLAALFNIEPLVTLLVAWLALGERMSALQFIGAALVLASILSVSLSRRTDATAE
jgi:drug/metabolite transporter (DMT)-like permease